MELIKVKLASPAPTTDRSTDWEMIQGAAKGSPRHREAFARHYYPLVRSYIAARWRGTRMISDIDDACQEIFAECFRSNGPLLRIDRKRAGGFRPFLCGIARNIARRIELRSCRASCLALQAGESLPSEDPCVSEAMDRSWALRIIQRAEARHRELARKAGGDALQRVELLRLRFHRDMPIRDIARLWNANPVILHRAYKVARQEFFKALQEVLSVQRNQPRHGIERSCRELLELLSCS